MKVTTGGYLSCYPAYGRCLAQLMEEMWSPWSGSSCRHRLGPASRNTCPAQRCRSASPDLNTDVLVSEHSEAASNLGCCVSQLTGQVGDVGGAEAGVEP